MEVKFFLCGQSCSLDVRRNSISIFHILEEVHAPAYPVVLPGLSIVALIALDEGEPIDPRIELRISLGDHRLFTGPFEANFEVRRTARVVAEFLAFVLPAPGLLRLVLHSAGREIANWQVPCEQNAPPQFELHFQPGENPGAQQAPGADLTPPGAAQNP